MSLRGAVSPDARGGAERCATLEVTMMRTAIVFAATAAIALIAGSASRSVYAADDVKATEHQLLEKWVEAAEKGDAATLTSLYAKDAILLPQGQPQPIKGEAAIRKFFDTAVNPPGLTKIKVTPSQVTPIDEKTYFGAGTWSAEAPGQNGAPGVQVGGTYLDVVANDGTAWKIIADTWNMMPPPGAEPATAAVPPATSSGSSTPNK